MASFIQKLPPVSLQPFPVSFLRCIFRLEHYQDSLFDFYGIIFPDTLRYAVASRRAEYLAGRYLAQQLLFKNGYGKETLLQDSRGIPCWPSGISGSISHTDKIAICAIMTSPEAGGLGVDVENLMVAEDAETLYQAIIDAEEHGYLKRQPLPFHILLTMVFSAKESAFKALSHRHVIRDFHDIKLLSVSLHLRQFYCQVAGRIWRGDYLFEAGCVFTALHINPTKLNSADAADILVAIH
jgi:4'-phosphopantetheinyl transferase EntD